MKTVQLNGETRETAAPDVHALLEELGLHDRRVAVMVNGQIVKRGNFETTEIRGNDQIEVISLIGGG